MLREIPSARLFEEVLKLFLSGNAADTFEMLVDLQLFDPLFPASAEALEHNPTYTHTLISEALINTDLRIKQNKPVTPAFLFAALLWPALPARVLRLQDRGMPPIPAMQEAAHELIAEQCQRIAIPKRFTMPIREIWDMQERLPRRSGKRADLLLDNRGSAPATTSSCCAKAQASRPMAWANGGPITRTPTTASVAT